MKKTLIIIGVGIIAGTTAYAIWYNLKKHKKTDKNEGFAQLISSTPIHLEDATAKTNTEDAKSSVHKSITERHKDAAHIIKNAVEVIVQKCDSPKIEIEELEEISNELDDLLKEG